MSQVTHRRGSHTSISDSRAGAAYEIARRQHGIISSSQLSACGYSRESVRRHVRALRLHRIHHATYSLGTDVLEPLARITAAQLAAGHDSVVSGIAAAYLHGFSRDVPERIHVIVPRYSRRVLEGVTVTRSRLLTARDVCVRHGIRVTSIARTLLECATHHDEYQVARLMHEAAFRNDVNPDDLRAVIEQHRRRRCAGVLRLAMRLVEGGSAGARSHWEREFLRRVRDVGLPVPRVNGKVTIPGGGVARATTIELDFYWPELGLVVEVDGRGHARGFTRRKDEMRDLLLERLDIRVVRCRSVDDMNQLICALSDVLAAAT